MIELIDTHCHIQSIANSGGEQVTSELWSKLDTKDLELVITRAKDEAVTRLIVVGCSLEDSKLAIAVAEEHSNIWASIGIHPHEAKDYVQDNAKREEFKNLATKPKVVAVGECGLDYYYGHSSPGDQHQVLEFQLSLAAEHNLPVIFHVREAFDDFWPILDKFKNIKGVLHSFTDSEANLNKALDRGLLIGVNGIATFTKDPSQTEMFKKIPSDSLVLETDSPFLTPQPLRGNINEPKNVRRVAEYLADLRGESLQNLSSNTTKNARQLFNV